MKMERRKTMATSKGKRKKYVIRPVIKITGEQIDFVDLILGIVGLVVEIGILVAIFVVK